MNCPSCQAAAPDGARFCMHCGTELATAVGREAIERLVPRQYLERLSAAHGRPAGERRVVTILFCDIKGSTAMAESLDPEDVMEVMNGAFQALVDPVYRYEGTLARLMGDAILAFFGAPIAHEDDAARACRAGLEMIERSRRYAERLERERGIRDFAVRVGINTGLVAVGEVGADLRVEYTAMGDAVNLAARMESAAEPGTVLVAAETRRLADDAVETESLGPVTVKGKSAPVEVFRVLRAREHGAAGAATARGVFVGREAELDTLRLAVASLSGGRGVRVSLTGAAGMGKTRLLAQARPIRPPGVAWFETRCASYARDTAWWSALGILHALLGSPPEVPADVPGGDALARILGGAVTAPPGAAGTDDGAAAVAAAFAALVERRAREGGVVLVWDDAQWIDESSLAVVKAIGAVCERAPVALIVSYRPDETAADVASILDAARDGVGVALEPLDRAHGDALAAAIVGTLAVPPALVAEVVEAAQGNPFFLEQVLSSLAAAAGLAHSGWNVRNLVVPTSLHAAVMSRIDALDPGDKHTLQAAAVLGRVFSRDVLVDVCDDDAGVLDASLAALAGVGLLQGERGDEVTFRQPVIAEVAYDSLLKSERARMHGRAGTAIEGRSRARRAELSPVLAYHYEAGGVREKAFEYLVLAARRARAMSANREAIRRYRRALALYDGRAPGEMEPLPGVVADIAAVYEELADACTVVARYDDARTHYDTAARLLADPLRLVTVRRKTAAMLLRWRRHDEARALYESILADAGNSLDSAEAAHLYSGLGMARYQGGDVDGAVTLVERALAAFEQLDDAQGAAQAWNNLGIIRARRGDPAGAETAHRRSLALWEELGDDHGAAMAHNNLGLALRAGGDGEGAAHAFEQAVARFERVGDRHGLACAYDNIAQAYMDLERLDEAHEYMKQAVAIMAELSTERSEMRPEMWQAGAL